MTSYFKVETLSPTSVVQCWTCGALVEEGRRTRHSDWHVELAAALAEANGQHPPDAGEPLPEN